ncbi:MAG: hypothetical protein FD124_3760, partial [Alphaproteobacteria bacterium]
REISVRCDYGEVEVIPHECAGKRLHPIGLLFFD